MTPPHSPPVVATVVTIAPERSIYSDAESHSPIPEHAAPARSAVEAVRTADLDGGGLAPTRPVSQPGTPQTPNPAQHLLPQTFGIPTNCQKHASKLGTYVPTCAGECLPTKRSCCSVRSTVVCFWKLCRALDGPHSASAMTAVQEKRKKKGYHRMLRSNARKDSARFGLVARASGNR
jgi:hypothetical protein